MENYAPEPANGNETNSIKVKKKRVVDIPVVFRFGPYKLIHGCCGTYTLKLSPSLIQNSEFGAFYIGCMLGTFHTRIDI